MSKQIKPCSDANCLINLLTLVPVRRLWVWGWAFSAWITGTDGKDLTCSEGTLCSRSLSDGSPLRLHNPWPCVWPPLSRARVLPGSWSGDWGRAAAEAVLWIVAMFVQITWGTFRRNQGSDPGKPQCVMSIYIFEKLSKRIFSVGRAGKYWHHLFPKATTTKSFIYLFFLGLGCKQSQFWLSFYAFHINLLFQSSL